MKYTLALTHFVDKETEAERNSLKLRSTAFDKVALVDIC